MGLPCISTRVFLLLAFHVLRLLQELDVVSAQTLDEIDKQALVDFKSGVSDNGGIFLTSWNDSVPLCEWFGVTCGQKHKRVTDVELGGLKLRGMVSPSISNLSFLRSLDLSGNSFHGTVPPEIGKLFRLQNLNLSNNVLGGGIPDGLSNCSNLLTLDLSSNKLEHDVPSELGSFSKLVLLYLDQNSLIGKFPASLGNLTSLQRLDIGDNHIEGGVPDSIARLAKIKFLRIAENKFAGGFSPAIYNLSSLEFLSIASNNFSGELRPDFGDLFPKLQVLYLGFNHFGGTIPVTLSNISTLEKLVMLSNNLKGGVPVDFGKLWRLQRLALGKNYFGSYSVGDLDFLGGLTNCTQLQLLDVGFNRLGGKLPSSIANLSSQLTFLSLKGNLISGGIPTDIGNLISLQTLRLEQNQLAGRLPDTLGKLSGLVGLILHSNRMSGLVPSSLGNLSRLGILHLYNNSFEGSITPSIGKCTYLQELGLASNELNGTIPQELMDFPSLVRFDISYNSLVGPFPGDIGKLKLLLVLNVSYNKLSGQIPQTLGKCLSLEYILLQGNSFHGAIPDIRGLTGLINLDLSNNNFSGPIPGYLANFSSLQNLNLSMNDFEGPVPTEGIFQNASAVSVFGNTKLCGGIPELKLMPCSAQLPTKPKRHSPIRKKIAIAVVVAVNLLLLTLLAIVFLCWFRKKTKNGRTEDNNDPSYSHFEPFYEKLSYAELYNATDGFSSGNLVGSGNFGVVFKGFIGSANKVFAVKVLNLHKYGAAKSFMAECEALGGIRHRNLVKIVTACSSIDFKGNEFRALVYEFLPNGSLDQWLHTGEVEGRRSPARTLTLHQRLNIAIDVASALVYLHDFSHSPIAHCDLKPSNVLLGEDLTAHISDFGLARLLLKFDQKSFYDQLSSAGIRGTIGYTAPEYGMGGQPSISGDVYSFGILLLEMFTGKRPTDTIFAGDFNLHSFTRLALPERVLDIADASIRESLDGRMDMADASECLKMVFHVGIRCSEESPVNRIAMAEALNKLVCIRERFCGQTKVQR